MINPLKTSIDLFIENNIHEDIVELSSTLGDLVNRISTRLSQDPDSLNFLIVVTDNKKPRYVFTGRELDSISGLVLDYIKKGNPFTAKISTLDLEAYKPKYVLHSPTDTAAKAYDIFKAEEADTIIAVDVNGDYKGKVKRNELARRVDLMSGKSSS